jgi:hypothetical protein
MDDRWRHKDTFPVVATLKLTLPLSLTRTRTPALLVPVGPVIPSTSIVISVEGRRDRHTTDH